MTHNDGFLLVRISHHLTVEARDKPAITSLRLLTLARRRRDVARNGGTAGKNARATSERSEEV